MTISFLASKPHLKPVTVTECEAKEKNVMVLIMAAHVPVASSCKGDGVCGKCRIHIVSGAENLSKESELEAKTKKKNRVSDHERLSCQTFVCGDVVIDTDYW